MVINCYAKILEQFYIRKPLNHFERNRNLLSNFFQFFVAFKSSFPVILDDCYRQIIVNGEEILGKLSCLA